MTTGLRRFEGRLFADGGCLFLVVQADEASGVARVSRRMDGRNEVIEMPLAEVARRLSTGCGLMLDNLNGPESERRVLKEDDAWYFSTREGRMGPFASEQESSRELRSYILSIQTENRAGREPMRAGDHRRGEQRAAHVENRRSA